VKSFAAEYFLFAIILPEEKIKHQTHKRQQKQHYRPRYCFYRIFVLVDDIYGNTKGGNRIYYQKNRKYVIKHIHFII
jgi:hypothetical protein